MYLSTKKNKKKLISQKDGFSRSRKVSISSTDKTSSSFSSRLTCYFSRQKNEKNVFVQKTLSEVKASVEDLDLSKQ